MVERKLYKTKLCMLYQRGRCHRQTCSFAHGNAELRRFSDSGGERRDFRDRDLREKLDRRHSPVGKYSFDRDARERHASRGRSPTEFDRDARERYASRGRSPTESDRDARERYASRGRSPTESDRDARERYASRGRSPAESVGRGTDRKRRMKHHSDGQSDISGSLNMSDETGDHAKPSDSKDILQLRQLQSEINLLDDQKRELEIYLEETTCQAESLASRVQELEEELFKEKEECKRITSNVKKFIEAYNNRSRLEGELKRSEAELQKLANKLSSDFVRTCASGEDSAINISDGGMAGKNTSPTKKRPRVHPEADETSNQALSVTASAKGRNASQRIAYSTQLNNEKKDKAEFNWENGYKTVVGEEKSKKGINPSNDMAFTNKPKASDVAGVLPSTSMAAHAADEDAEVVETGEKLKVAGNATKRAGKGTPSGIPEYPFLPPPPPLPADASLQYKRGDDADGLDEEMLEVDID